MNRAVQGDIVVVEVFPESEWKAPADAVVDQECECYFKLFKRITMFIIFGYKATLKNDNPDESEEESQDEAEEAEKTEEKKLLKSERSNPVPIAVKQPTGRIIGVIKRNWRA